MNDLLKVLDMSEDEQITWFYRRHEKELHDIVWISPVAKFKQYRLANLAFRLRDEVRREKGNYDHAVYIVYNYEKQKRKYENVFYWMAYIAKPIHWVIASLIAKEKEDV